MRWFRKRQPRTYGPYPCPRCGSEHMRGHASTEAQGLTCINCGWVRYLDPVTYQLWDVMDQPPGTTAHRPPPPSPYHKQTRG